MPSKLKPGEVEIRAFSESVVVAAEELAERLQAFRERQHVALHWLNPATGMTRLKHVSLQADGSLVETYSGDPVTLDHIVKETMSPASPQPRAFTPSRGGPTFG